MALDNKCVTQVLRGDANSAEVSYIAPENFSMKDRSTSDDEFETMEFSSLEPESHTLIKRKIKIEREATLPLNWLPVGTFEIYARSPCVHTRCSQVQLV